MGDKLSILPLLVGDTGRECRNWGSDPGRCAIKATGCTGADEGVKGLCGEDEGLDLF